MQDNYQKYLMNILLDKYEKSKHWKEEARVQRRVSFPFGREQFPEYYQEGLSSKIDNINSAAMYLEEIGAVKIKWVRSEIGNLIEILYLNLDQINHSYELVNRVPLKDDIGSMIQNLEQVKSSFSLEWIRNFIDSCLEQLNNKKIPSHLSKEVGDIDLLFKALIGIQKINGGIPIPERLFSTRFLGNSKTFEKHIRNRIVTIFKKYGAKAFQTEEHFSLDEMEEEEILQELGILKSIEELMIRGAMKFELKGNNLDYAPFVYGSVLDSSSIRLGQIIEFRLDTLLIIENKAVFKELIRRLEEGRELTVGANRFSLTSRFKNALIVYLGGFPGPDKRMFFKKLREFIISNQRNQGFNYYFWGDLDYGGMQIYRHLRSVVLPELQPFLMDKKTWEHYSSYGESIDLQYKKKINRLYELGGNPELKEVLEAMLVDGLRLEQESMLID